MRTLPFVAVATVLVCALVRGAGAFPEAASYQGGLKGKVKAIVPGRKPIKLKPNDPSTSLAIDGPAGTFTIRTGTVTLVGKLAANAKPGRFDVIQPTGEDLDVLIDGVEQYLDTSSPVGVAVSDVQVKGVHKMKKDGAKLGSVFVLEISGTTDLFSLPFTATAKLKYKGAQAVK